MRERFQPLRVALIASSLKLAGAEKQTVYLTRALHEAGVEVNFFHLGEGGHYETILRKMGVSFTQIYKRSQPGYMLVRLTRALAQFRPQIVFAPQFGDLLQAGIAGRLCNALTLGGLRSDGFYELRAHGRRSPWMLRLAHGLVANSHRARQNLATRGINTSVIRILPNGLDLDEFDARMRTPPPITGLPNRVMAVAVGRLKRSKRFDRFLKALAMARRQAPALFGVIAGSDQGSGPALTQLARDLGLVPNHVVFLGECCTVPALLARAGFLVLCSEYEGFPNVILEAMAARLPVISTPVGDADRVVLQDQTGYLVSEFQIEDMAARMVTLARSAATRVRLGWEGRKRVARHYNYEALPGRVLTIFHDFARRNNRPQLAQRLAQRLQERADGVMVYDQVRMRSNWVAQPVEVE